MTTDTTMAEDPDALESGETLPKLEVFGSPIERKLVLDGVLAAVFEGPGDNAPSTELAARVGRYSILRKLGEGGMGVVLLGYDDQLHREAAIKLIRANRSGPEAQQRMLREAQGLARLSHPNVVQVYEGGVHEGSAYIAMELVAGRTLTQWLSDEPEQGAILDVFRAAGRGLAAAHAAGLVHRDFKPDNVMIAEDGQVKVMDFGLARALEIPGEFDASASGPQHGAREALPTPAPDRQDTGGSASSSGLSAPLTRTGALLGTPAYMSPEQFATGQFDERSDQFSYCVALWEALHGARPFRGRNIVELSAAVSSGRIEPPSGEARVPARVERALRRGLAVEPAGRWPSMDALLEALDHDPAPRRRRWAVAATLVLALAGVSGVLAPYFLPAPQPPGPVCPDGHALLEPWQPAQREALVANLTALGGDHGEQLSDKVVEAFDTYADAWASAHQDACEATHVRHEQSAQLLDARMRCLDERSHELGALIEVLSTPGATSAGRAMPVIAGLVPVEVCGNRDYLESQVPLPADPELAAAVEALRQRSVEVKAAAELGYPEVIAKLRDFVEQADALGYEPLQAELLYTLGSVQASIRPAEEAEATLEAALLAALSSGQDRIAASAAMELGYVVGYRLGDDDAATHYIALAGAWNQRFDAPPIDRARLKLTEVLVLSRSKEPDAAARVVAGVTAIQQIFGVFYRDGRLEGVEELEVSEAYIASVALNIMAIGAYNDGNMREARAIMREVSSLRRRLLTPDHHQVQLMELNLASVDTYFGDWDEAEARLRMVYDDIRARGEGRPQDLAILHINLSEVVLARLEVLGQGEPAAMVALEAATEDIEPLGDHPGVDVAQLHHSRSRLHRLLGQFDEADAALDEADAALGEVPEEGPRRVSIMIERGAIALARGEHGEALAIFEAANLETHVLPATRAVILHGHGEALLGLGREDEAIVALRGAIALWDGIQPKGHPWSALSHDLLAELDIPEAEDHRRRAAAIRERLVQ